MRLLLRFGERLVDAGLIGAERAATLQERYNFRYPLQDALKRRMDNPKAEAASLTFGCARPGPAWRSCPGYLTS